MTNTGRILIEFFFVECRSTRAVNYMVRQAVPYTNEPEHRSLQQCCGTLAVHLQLAVVLVSGCLRMVVMLSRGRWVKEGCQICLCLSGHAVENKVQHRNIPSNTKRCEIVVKKRFAP